MALTYKLTDVEKVKNKHSVGNIQIDPMLLDFQKFVYAIQLAESEFINKSKDIHREPRILVINKEKFDKYKELFNEFFTNFLEYDVNVKIIKSQVRPSTQSRFKPLKYEFISLFSGGLDSGSFAIANAGKKGVLHHTQTNNTLFGKSKILFKKHLKNSCLESTSTYLAIEKKPSYLKTRGLVFVTNLLCMAKHFKIKKIIIPENGPFMHNLPISPSISPTQTTNPHMITEWTRIFNKITTSKIQTEFPFIDNTKSEVIIKSGNKDYIADTWSCSYVQGIGKMCGLCNSCVVRILSCYAIDCGEDLDSSYKKNIFRMPFDELKKTNKNTYRVSIDAVDFWAKIINPDQCGNEIEKEEFNVIRNNYEIMINHSLDMFLGFRKYKNEYSDSNEVLFEYFKKRLKKIDSKVLDDRLDSLERQKRKARWP